MNGLILLPTLNRPVLLKRFIDSYVETKAEVPVWILVDETDKSYDGISTPDQIKFINTGPAVTMGDKCRYVWDDVKKDIPEWTGLLNDDHVCITPEWDKKVEALIDGTNMVSTNDGYWNFGTNVVGCTAWSMPLLESAGFPIFPRNLQHYFIDNIWKAIGDATGCWTETMTVNIEHRHVFRGLMEADDTFRKVNDQKATAYCQKEAEYFMQHDLAEVVERIKKLRSGHALEAKFV